MNKKKAFVPVYGTSADFSTIVVKLNYVEGSTMLKLEFLGDSLYGP